MVWCQKDADETQDEYFVSCEVYSPSHMKKGFIYVGGLPCLQEADKENIVHREMKKNETNDTFELFTNSSYDEDEFTDDEFSRATIIEEYYTSRSTSTCQGCGAILFGPMPLFCARCNIYLIIVVPAMDQTILNELVLSILQNEEANGKILFRSPEEEISLNNTKKLMRKRSLLQPSISIEEAIFSDEDEVNFLKDLKKKGTLAKRMDEIKMMAEDKYSVPYGDGGTMKPKCETCDMPLQQRNGKGLICITCPRLRYKAKERADSFHFKDKENKQPIHVDDSIGLSKFQSACRLYESKVNEVQQSIEKKVKETAEIMISKLHRSENTAPVIVGDNQQNSIVTNLGNMNVVKTRTLVDPKRYVNNFRSLKDILLADSYSTLRRCDTIEIDQDEYEDLEHVGMIETKHKWLHNDTYANQNLTEEEDISSVHNHSLQGRNVEFGHCKDTEERDENITLDNIDSARDSNDSGKDLNDEEAISSFINHYRYIHIKSRSSERNACSERAMSHNWGEESSHFNRRQYIKEAEVKDGAMCQHLNGKEASSCYIGCKRAPEDDNEATSAFEFHNNASVENLEIERTSGIDKATKTILTEKYNKNLDVWINMATSFGDIENKVEMTANKVAATFLRSREESCINDERLLSLYNRVENGVGVTGISLCRSNTFNTFDVCHQICKVTCRANDDDRDDQNAVCSDEGIDRIDLTSKTVSLDKQIGKDAMHSTGKGNDDDRDDQNGVCSDLGIGQFDLINNNLLQSFHLQCNSDPSVKTMFGSNSLDHLNMCNILGTQCGSSFYKKADPLCREDINDDKVTVHNNQTKLIDPIECNHSDSKNEQTKMVESISFRRKVDPPCRDDYDCSNSKNLKILEVDTGLDEQSRSTIDSFILSKKLEPNGIEHLDGDNISGCDQGTNLKDCSDARGKEILFTPFSHKKMLDPTSKENVDYEIMSDPTDNYERQKEFVAYVRKLSQMKDEFKQTFEKSNGITKMVNDPEIAPDTSLSFCKDSILADEALFETFTADSVGTGSNSSQNPPPTTQNTSLRMHEGTTSTRSSYFVNNTRTAHDNLGGKLVDDNAGENVSGCNMNKLQTFDSSLESIREFQEGLSHIATDDTVKRLDDCVIKRQEDTITILEYDKWDRNNIESNPQFVSDVQLQILMMKELLKGATFDEAAEVSYFINQLNNIAKDMREIDELILEYERG